MLILFVCIFILCLFYFVLFNYLYLFYVYFISFLLVSFKSNHSWPGLFMKSTVCFSQIKVGVATGSKASFQTYNFILIYWLWSLFYLFYYHIIILYCYYFLLFLPLIVFEIRLYIVYPYQEWLLIEDKEWLLYVILLVVLPIYLRLEH